MDRRRLLLLHDIFGDWDIPGGRMLPAEFGGDITAVIKRKIHEELGDDVIYHLEGPCTSFQVQRIEHDSNEPALIFGIGFLARYHGGVIKLGPHHDKYKWVDVDKLNPTEYFQHGWEKGIADYLKRTKG